MLICLCQVVDRRVGGVFAAQGKGRIKRCSNGIAGHEVMLDQQGVNVQFLMDPNFLFQVLVFELDAKKCFERTEIFDAEPLVNF